jgi:riboflavin synthase
MFTGIISELGVVTGRVDGDQLMRMTVRAPTTCVGLSIGDSIAVNGVCLTAVGVTGESFTVEAVAETLERTSLDSIELDERVNLERPVSASGRYDGHVVQGHVDGVAVVLSVELEGAAHRMRFDLPEALSRYVVEKGSIALDGTSLTITAVSAPNDSSPWIEVVLIPHTIEATALGAKVPGDRVNVEIDILAKYIERLTETNR